MAVLTEYQKNQRKIQGKFPIFDQKLITQCRTKTLNSNNVEGSYIDEQIITPPIEPDCVTCLGFDKLSDFAAHYEFNPSETPDASFPFHYSGSTLDGITVIPGASLTVTVQTDGSDIFLGKDGCGATGAPYSFDDSMIFFDGVVKKNFTLSYEYSMSPTCPSGGKHFLLVAAKSNLVTDNSILNIGSWSPDNTHIVANFQLRAQYPNLCLNEWPPDEIPNYDLPQPSSDWRTRTITKHDDTIMFTDDTFGPVSATRCWFNLGGHVGMFIRDGARIRNITVSL